MVQSLKVRSAMVQENEHWGLVGLLRLSRFLCGPGPWCSRASMLFFVCRLSCCYYFNISHRRKQIHNQRYNRDTPHKQSHHYRYTRDTHTIDKAPDSRDTPTKTRAPRLGTQTAGFAFVVLLWCDPQLLAPHVADEWSAASSDAGLPALTCACLCTYTPKSSCTSTSIWLKWCEVK